MPDEPVHEYEEDRPYGGEALGGAAASVCPGFDPEPVRFLFYQPAMRILIVFGVIVTLLIVGAFAAGTALHVPGGGWWPGLLALPFYGIGILLILVLLIDLALLGVGYGPSVNYFKNALLTPGVVVTSKPLTIVVLAPLGNGQGPAYHGLHPRPEITPVPRPHTGHAHPVRLRLPARRGSRPLAVVQSRADLLGNGPARPHRPMLPRLGTRISTASTPLSPKDSYHVNDDELILLDEHDNKLDTFSIRDEKKKYAVNTPASP